MKLLENEPTNSLAVEIDSSSQLIDTKAQQERDILDQLKQSREDHKNSIGDEAYEEKIANSYLLNLIKIPKQAQKQKAVSEAHIANSAKQCAEF